MQLIFRQRPRPPLITTGLHNARPGRKFESHLFLSEIIQKMYKREGRAQDCYSFSTAARALQRPDRRFKINSPATSAIQFSKEARARRAKIPPDRFEHMHQRRVRRLERPRCKNRELRSRLN